MDARTLAPLPEAESTAPPLLTLRDLERRQRELRRALIDTLGDLETIAEQIGRIRAARAARGAMRQAIRR